MYVFLENFVTLSTEMFCPFYIVKGLDDNGPSSPHHEADVDGFSTPEELNSRPVNENLLGFASTFHLPRGYKVMVPKVTDRPARSPPGYIAISSHHLHAGLRFILPTFLLCVLNLLRLASMQLTPNSYAQLISFYLTFRRRGFGSPSDNIIRYCYSLKKCPLSEKSFGSAWHEGIYYLPVVRARALRSASRRKQYSTAF
ncbi:hypothetical protein ACOSQ2_024161 [Xanthoceras sorbifolium]